MNLPILKIGKKVKLNMEVNVIFFLNCTVRLFGFFNYEMSLKFQ